MTPMDNRVGNLYPSIADVFEVHDALEIRLDILCNRRASPTPQILRPILRNPIRNRNSHPYYQVRDVYGHTDTPLDTSHGVGGFDGEEICDDDPESKKGCDERQRKHHDRGPEFGLLSPWAAAASHCVLSGQEGVNGLSFLRYGRESYGGTSEASEETKIADSAFEFLEIISVIILGIGKRSGPPCLVQRVWVLLETGSRFHLLRNSWVIEGSRSKDTLV